MKLSTEENSGPLFRSVYDVLISPSPHTGIQRDLIQHTGFTGGTARTRVVSAFFVAV